MEIRRPTPIQESRTWADQLDQFKRLKGEKKKSEIWKDGERYKIETNGLPYCPIMGLSDIHLGAIGTDYEALGKYVRAINDYGIQVFLAGDLADLFNPKILSHAMLGDVNTPDEQLDAARSFLHEIKDNCLGIIGGNHEDFAKNSAGIDVYRWINRDTGIPLLKAGSKIEIEVNDQKYNIAIWHKLINNSRFNNTHAGKQALRMATEGMDLIMSGDKHIGALEQFVHQRRIANVVQLGTFKVDDSWGREGGMHPLPQVFFPVHFFDGRRHNIEHIRDLDAATELIDLYGEAVKKKAIGMLGLASQGSREDVPNDQLS